MQPQRREVPVENDEYEREQQRLAKQVRRVVALRNDLILAFCTVQKRVHLPELFQRNTYALPSFLHFLHFVAHACSPVPRLLPMPKSGERARTIWIIWSIYLDCVRSMFRSGMHLWATMPDCPSIHFDTYSPLLYADKKGLWDVYFLGMPIFTWHRMSWRLKRIRTIAAVWAQRTYRTFDSLCNNLAWWAVTRRTPLNCQNWGWALVRDNTVFDTVYRKASLILFQHFVLGLNDNQKVPSSVSSLCSLSG